MNYPYNRCARSSHLVLPPIRARCATRLILKPTPFVVEGIQAFGSCKSLVALFLFIVFIVLQFFFIPTPAGADDIDELKKEMTTGQARLEELSRMVAREKEQLAEAAGKEKTLLGDLDLIERKLRYHRNKSEELLRRIGVNRSNIKRIEREISRLETEVTGQNRSLSKRLAAMYKFGKASGLKVLFASSSYSDLQRRRKYLTLVVESDRRLIGRLEEGIDRLSMKRKDLGEEEKSLKAHRRELEETRRSLARSRRNRLAMIKSIRKDKANYLKAIEEFRSSSEDLQGMLDSLAEQIRRLDLFKGAKPGGSILERKGFLAPPVKGPVISEFGKRENPDFENVVTHNNGIEIRADEGTAIKAVDRGVVLWSDWFKGYGNLIIVDHGEGFYSLYAHCSELKKKVGDKVADREVIAKVGRTGSLKGPNLYFEIRRNGKAVNPRHWLHLPLKLK